MRKLTRRDFWGTSAGLIAAGTLAGCAEGQQAEATEVPAGPKPFDKPISFQSYGMRRQVGEDFPGMMASVKELGYGAMEMCSPRGPHYQEVGFGNLTALPGEEVAQMIADAGLICKGSHFESREIIGADEAETREKASASAEYAVSLGLIDVIMSGSGLSGEATMDQFRRWGELCSVAGQVMKDAGLRLGYHNHAIGPVMEDGETLQYDFIMSVCDPDLVGMQFQLLSITGGYDIVEYIKKYEGRYIALHMADYDPELPGRREGTYGATVPCGEGIIDWPALLNAAMKSPILEHGWIVEIETEEPLDGLRRSMDFFKTLEI